MEKDQNSLLSADRPLSIAICGIRGIPANYGGFETFAEELATRLAAHGHKVRVYGRSRNVSRSIREYRGVQLVVLPAPKHKYLETPIHGLLSFLHLIFHRTDVALVCNAANSPFVWILRLFRIPVAINVDGIERQRAKWNMLGRLWYRIGEICSVWFSSRIVADAEVIRKYYQETYHVTTSVIAYGYRTACEEEVQKKIQTGVAQTKNAQALNLFAELGISENNYILYVSRLEPENNAHVVIAAYNRLPEELRRYKLLIVGDAPYAANYIADLRAHAGKNVIFAGYRFGESYEYLQVGAYLYVQATEVGGTHPALVEAMGFGNAVVANATPENKEVLGDAGMYYAGDSDALTKVFQSLLTSPQEVQTLRKKARARAQLCYDWERICHDYEQLFTALAQR